MSNLINDVKIKITKMYEISKPSIYKGFEGVRKVFFLCKRTILRDVKLSIIVGLSFVIILQFLYTQALQQQYHTFYDQTSEAFEEIKIIVDEYEVKIEEYEKLVQHLHKENAVLNELNNKQKELIEKLNHALDVIAKQLGSTRDKLLSNTKSVSRGGEVVKKVTMNISAYTAGVESTGKTSNHPAYGLTASGTKVKEGRTIACPPSYPFGTQIYIPYFDNTFTCEDRGGAIKEGKLDIYMKDLSDAIKFGRRELEVHIIKWGE